MYELKDKVVLVTGGANGIGEALIREIIKENPKFIGILDVDTKKGNEVCKELASKYGADKVKFINCDVTNDKEFAEAFRTVVEKNGYIDLVINNAGIANEDVDHYKKEIDINYTAVVTGTIKALELMRKDRGGKGGTVINISSTAALSLTCPAFFVYGGTKSAVAHFSTTIGMNPYYSKTSVRVLAICFGCVDSDIFNKTRSFDPEITENLSQIIHGFLKGQKFQSCEFAARETLEAYKRGESGSTWLITNNKPALDITAKFKEAYDILSSVAYGDS